MCTKNDRTSRRTGASRRVKHLWSASGTEELMPHVGITGPKWWYRVDRATDVLHMCAQQVAAVIERLLNGDEATARVGLPSHEKHASSTTFGLGPMIEIP